MAVHNRLGCVCCTPEQLCPFHPSRLFRRCCTPRSLVRDFPSLPLPAHEHAHTAAAAGTAHGRAITWAVLKPSPAECWRLATLTTRMLSFRPFCRIRIEGTATCYETRILFSDTNRVVRVLWPLQPLYSLRYPCSLFASATPLSFRPIGSPGIEIISCCSGEADSRTGPFAAYARHCCDSCNSGAAFTWATTATTTGQY
jgi:hypothetical protein